MKIGLVGLGKMGYNLGLNLQSNGYEVYAYDLQKQIIEKSIKDGMNGVYTIQGIVNYQQSRKVVILLVVAGSPVDQVIEGLLDSLSPNDIIIDCGNSNYKDSIRRYEYLKEKQIDYLDCGTSGGPSGALNGACTMIGGDKEVFDYCEPIFKAFSLEQGYLYTGPSGSGHFVKMVHNGIEYGIMQSIAEGFELLNKSNYDFDFEKVANLWNNGSVIRSWLMELVESAFQKDKNLDSIKGIMHSSGEAQWAIETALELQVPIPAIALSQFMRYRSLEEDTFSGKVIAALRNEFGGHDVVK